VTAGLLELSAAGQGSGASQRPSAAAPWSGWEPGTGATMLVAASHGTASPTGQAAISSLVDAVAAARPDLAVLPAFVDVQAPRVDAVLGAAGEGARIVPLLLSSGFHTRHDLASAAASQRGTTVARALGPDPRLAAVLERRLLEAGARARDQVVLACAGSTDPAGVTDCREMARMLSERLGTKVEPAFVSAAPPAVPEAVERASARRRRRWFPRGRVVVASYLLAPGHFAARVAAVQADVVAQPLLVPGAEVPPELVELVLEHFDRW
jgi:sirohydrochlorin ferrochelatase